MVAKILANPVRIKRISNDCFYIFLRLHWGMDANSLPTVAITCKCLRMTYEHYDCFTNALLIPSDLNANDSYSAVACRFGSQNGVFIHDTFLVQL